MHSHFFLLILFAFFVSFVFALISRDEATAQLRFGGMLFAGFVGAAVLFGWLMFPFPF